MYSSPALCPTVFVPFVAAHDFTNTVQCIGIVRADSYFGTYDFKYLNMLSTTFAPCGMATLCCVAYNQFYKHAILALLPTPDWSCLGENGRLGQDILCIYRATEVRAPEVRAPEVRAPEVRATEVRAPEVRAPEVRAPEVRATEVRATEVRAPEVRAPEVRAPEVRATEVRATEVRSESPSFPTSPLSMCF